MSNWGHLTHEIRCGSAYIPGNIYQMFAITVDFSIPPDSDAIGASNSVERLVHVAMQLTEFMLGLLGTAASATHGHHLHIRKCATHFFPTCQTRKDSDPESTHLSH